MRLLALGILLALGLAACQEEGSANKARVTPREQIIQEQQRQQERVRVLQEQRQTVPPTTR